METKEKKTIVQKISLKETSPLAIAQRYYNLLSAISNVPLTDREIQLMAFTAIKGNISYPNNREEFCNLYESSSATINNIVSKLKKLGLLIKDGDKVKVNPQYLLSFEKDIILQISLLHG
jgi:hypothetical protein